LAVLSLKYASGQTYRQTGIQLDSSVPTGSKVITISIAKSVDGLGL